MDIDPPAALASAEATGEVTREGAGFPQAPVTGEVKPSDNAAASAAAPLPEASANPSDETTQPAAGLMEVDPAPADRTADIATETTMDDAQRGTISIVVEETTTSVEIIEPTAARDGEAGEAMIIEEATTTITQQTSEAASGPSTTGQEQLEQIVQNGIEEPAQPALQALVNVPDPIAVASSSSHRGLVPRSASPSRMYRTGYVFDHLMMLHCADGYQPTADEVLDDAGGHPEEPMRIKRIFTRLADMGLIKRMMKLPFKQVTMDQALLVHTEDHWHKVQGTESES
jgi:histone deacetylase 6